MARVFIVAFIVSKNIHWYFVFVMQVDIIYQEPLNPISFDLELLLVGLYLKKQSLSQKVIYL